MNFHEAQQTSQGCQFAEARELTVHYGSRHAPAYPHLDRKDRPAGVLCKAPVVPSPRVGSRYNFDEAKSGYVKDPDSLQLEVKYGPRSSLICDFPTSEHPQPDETICPIFKAAKLAEQVSRTTRVAKDFDLFSVNLDPLAGPITPEFLR
jgi:hypothetical protein